MGLTPGQRRGGVTVRTRLLAAVLLPLLLVTTFGGLVAVDRQQTVRATTTLRERTGVLADLAMLRTRVFEERRQFETVTRPAAFGVDPATVSGLIGMEVVADPTTARAATDAAIARIALNRRPFTDATLAALRADIDTSAVDTEGASARFSALESSVVASLDVALEDVARRAVGTGDVTLEQAVRTMNDSVQVAGLRGRQIQALVGLWFAGDASHVPPLAELARATELYERTAHKLDVTPVRSVARAWSSADAAGAAFSRAISDELAGTPSAGLDVADLTSIGRVLGDGLRHYEAIASLPELASVAVSDSAADRGARARADAERAVAAAVASILFAVGAALCFGRSITRPLHNLTEQVRSVSDGDLALAPLALRGPPELRVASAAFNEVAANLNLIEQKALALSACDFTSPAVTTALPGRLGEALNTSLQVLAKSIIERHQLQSRLLHQATHDSLTGLANRRAVIETLGAAVERSRRSGSLLAVTFIDLDDFKATNDSSGHAIGDLLLQAVAERMRGAARRGDVVARLGGDEFVIVAEHIGGPDEVMALVRRVLDAVASPIEIDGRDYTIKASAGVALNHDLTDDPLSLLAKADLAVYRSKQRSPSVIELYDEQLQRVVRDHAEIEAALAAALACGGHELELHYQPIVDASTGAVVSLEALVRWDRPDEGLMQPDQFIPIAEVSDLIVRLDCWVLQAATRQLAAWSDHPLLSRITMAVNISGRHITDVGFVDNVVQALEVSGIAPHRLVLEVTETALVKDLPRAAAQIEVVRALGVAVAADDFGTGHTGLAHVRALTVDEIKIDRSFTIELPAVTELVQIVIDLARHLGVRTVAEGVETPQQADALRALGCSLLQGYLFSPALPPADLLRWLHERHGLPGVWSPAAAVS